MNMGEAQLHQFKIEEGIYSYVKAVELGDVSAPARLLRAKVYIYSILCLSCLFMMLSMCWGAVCRVYIFG